MIASFSFQRFLSVGRKELIHVLRDPANLFFALFIPVVELVLLGYAIDTNVRDLRTVVYDQARTQESRAWLLKFRASGTFKITDEVFSDADLREAIVAGRAKVGVKIPENFSRNLQGGTPAQVQVLVDGSESSTAGEALNVGNALALQESLGRALGDNPLAVDARPRLLFNPDTRSANFFIPGLLVVMCQMMAVMFTANALVREKENGTLEQLYMTPVRGSELILGKLVPYVLFSMTQFCWISFLMRVVFQVPIHGPFLTLLLIAFPFILGMLGMGLLISTRAASREAAGQMAMGTVIPSVFLSGYVFPIDSMPVICRFVAYLIPTTWMIDASRGVVLRGADWRELWPHAAVLWGQAVVLLTLSALKFKKSLS